MHHTHSGTNSETCPAAEHVPLLSRSGTNSGTCPAVCPAVSDALPWSHRTLAQAWRGLGNFWLGVARAWRGNGAGLSCDPWGAKWANCTRSRHQLSSSSMGCLKIRGRAATCRT
eukprot:gene18147-biopygen20422